jgi:hypothetical protein
LRWAEGDIYGRAYAGKKQMFQINAGIAYNDKNLIPFLK